jgi:hypothetical protein
MKKGTSILFSMFLLVQMTQAQTYLPLPKNTGRWLETIYSPMGPAYNKSYTIFQKDTTTYSLAGHPYRKFEQIADTFYNTAQLQSAAYLFDDSTNQRIYAYTLGNEILLYDFSKNVGDTIRNLYCAPGSTTAAVVDSINIQNFHGINRQVFYLSDTASSPQQSVWIEGIGSEDGLLKNVRWCQPPDPVHELICVHQQQTQLYGSTCDFIFLSVDDPESYWQQWQVKQNPVRDGEIHLSYPEHAEFEFSLTDTQGKILLRGKEKSIPVHHLPDGLYFLQIRHAERQHSFKVILQH